MVESKVNPGRRLGFERLKYLDMANLSFAEQNWIGCRGYIDAFLETIVEESKAADMIKEQFADVEADRKEQQSTLDEKATSLGYLEQRDLMERGKLQIEMEYVHSQKTVCWQVALEMKLFEDQADQDYTP